VLPPSLVEVLKEYKKTVDSRWMFPSPQNPDSPRYPTGTGDILGRIIGEMSTENEEDDTIIIDNKE